MAGLFSDRQNCAFSKPLDISFKKFSSNKLRLIAIFVTFFSGLILCYFFPLFQDDITKPVQSRLISLICLNVLFLTVFFIIIRKAGSSYKFFALKDKAIIIGTLAALVSNIELFWAYQEPGKSSPYALAIIAILPSTLYISLVDKLIHWGLVMGYFGVLFIRLENSVLEFLIALNVMLTIILYIQIGVRSPKRKKGKELRNEHLMNLVFEMTSNNSEKAYMVINKNFELVFGNEYFYNFFERTPGSITSAMVHNILKDITKVSCKDKLVETIEEKESEFYKEISIKSFRGHEAEKFFRRGSSTKGQTIKSYLGESIDDSLNTIATLFFEYSAMLQSIGIGWDNDHKIPMFYTADGSYEAQKHSMQFAYINLSNENLFLLEFNCSHCDQDFTSTPSNLSMTDIATIIHEIRTPLNGTTFLVEQAIESDIVPLEVKEGLLIPCLVSTKRLGFIVNDILDFAQILEGKFRLCVESFNLTNVLHSSLQIIQALARSKGLDIYLQIDPNIPANISTDQNRLIQILYNLMGNAIKFTKEGYIKLSVGLSVNEPKFIEFAVEDTGYGIKQEDLKRLFKVFEKLDNWHDNKVGCGLGLSIGNQLAKALGKNITVESEYKKGSVFRFCIENREKNGSNKNLDATVKRSKILDPEADLRDKRNKMFSYEELPPRSSGNIPSVFESPKMKPTLNRKESNEIKTETPNAANRTVHFDFSNNPVSVPNKQTDTYHIRVDPGIDEVLKEEEDTIDFGLINRSNSGVPFLRGKMETSNNSLLSPARNKCQCIKVLGVDDEPINTISLQFTLRELGLREKFFNNGDDIIDFLLKNGDRLICNNCKGPYFILMDCFMPGKDGFETTEEIIKAMNQRKIIKIPIIACTADETDVLDLKVKQCRMTERIKKPISRPFFESLIQKYNLKQHFGEIEETKEKLDSE